MDKIKDILIAGLVDKEELRKYLPSVMKKYRKNKREAEHMLQALTYYFKKKEEVH